MISTPSTDSVGYGPQIIRSTEEHLAIVVCGLDSPVVHTSIPGSHTIPQQDNLVSEQSIQITPVPDC
jgi:hypothetical protein